MEVPLSILVVDDEPNIRRMLTIQLEAAGHTVVAVSNPDDARGEAGRRSIDLALVDLRLGTRSGLDLVPQLLADSPWLKVVVITAYAAVDTAVEAMRRGAADYLAKPFTPAQVDAVVARVQGVRLLERQVADLESELGRAVPEADLTSASPAMQRAVTLARDVADSDATVLVRGESGTGKGVLARAIHGWSRRSGKPFAVVSCPSLSPELLESELFGHAKGAFTGAVKDSAGRIAAAEGGTLFLDEIGDLPAALQPKLLRFLQDRRYERVGEAVTRRADVRVVSATNVDLDAAVRAGRFRQDLLYRINVIQIDLPPLRDRPDDVVALARRLLGHFAGGVRGRPVGFTPDAEAALRAYAWPGNVRELRNVVERAAILCRSERVGVEHLPANVGPATASAEPQPGGLVTLDQLEEAHVRRVLAATRSLDEAADVLGIDPATLYRKRKKYGI
ncbi:MAG TPA: sigma-54 dependent transcriptional regulator [Humisphaera sp.]